MNTMMATKIATPQLIILFYEHSVYSRSMNRMQRLDNTIVTPNKAETLRKVTKARILRAPTQLFSATQ